MSDKQSVNIHVVHNPPPMPLAHVIIQDVLMACRNCGATMERGTQCPRCRAWCR